MKQLALLSICTAVMVGCGSTDTSRNKKSVEFGDGTVTFYDFRDVSALHRSAFPMPAGESIYMFNFTGPRATITTSDGTVVKYTGSYAESCGKGLDPEQYQNKALFSECFNKIQSAQKRLDRSSRPGFEQLIALGERAVKAEGSCTWTGYDRQLDRQFRSVGALARSDDQRVFFARLRCQ
ncbi:hypothetical protein [uncultured Roseobacter sp.]|uniref:hypothetical protein n=1 Tax=uncultured Roseobacter sp. TaxID=114847 RepID=UPI0026380E36|nr:hypothetical protein [uncultured Roseobacter sp.]